MLAQFQFWGTTVIGIVLILIGAWLAWKFFEVIRGLTSKNRKERHDALEHGAFVGLAAFFVMFFGINLASSGPLQTLGNFLVNGVKMGGG